MTDEKPTIVGVDLVGEKLCHPGHGTKRRGLFEQRHGRGRRCIGQGEQRGGIIDRGLILVSQPKRKICFVGPGNRARTGCKADIEMISKGRPWATAEEGLNLIRFADLWWGNARKVQRTVSLNTEGEDGLGSAALLPDDRDADKRRVLAAPK